MRWECLEKFIVFGKSHLDYLVGEFVAYYNLPPVRDEPDEVVTLKLRKAA